MDLVNCIILHQGDLDMSDWIIHTGNSNNFENSSKHMRWGVDSAKRKTFVATVSSGDRLWFIRKGRFIAVSTFKNLVKRQLGPLIVVGLTNEELGWEGDGSWDTEVHYVDLYNLTNLCLEPNIKGQTSLRIYDPSKCTIDLESEYANIVKYSRVSRTM